jgi:hypothetical protein
VEPTSAATPQGMLRSQSIQGQTIGSDLRRPAEDQFVRLANEIPGFAGLIISPSHELIALVNDTTVARSAHAFVATALRNHLANDGLGIPSRIRPANIRIVSATYDFQTLARNRDFASDSLLGPFYGVASVDLDEFIEVWYNRERRHSSLVYVSPGQCEQDRFAHSARAA